MKVHWQFDQSDAERVHALIKSAENDPSFQSRIAVLNAEKPPVSKDSFWHSLAIGLLTSQRRTPLAIIDTVPFPLRLEACLPEIDRLVEFVSGELMQSRWVLQLDKIGRQFSANLNYLESGGWQPTLSILEQARTLQTPESEHDAVAFIDDHFTGCGPHVSRKILQSLGLTRFEIPISKRLIKWLNQNDFPIRLPPIFLNDSENYNFVSIAICKLCEHAGVSPYVLGAAISNGS